MQEEARRGEEFLAQGERVTIPGVRVWSPFKEHGSTSAESYRLFAFDADPAIVRALLDFPLPIHDDDRAGFQSAVDTARQRRTDWDVSYRVIHRDGTVHHVRAIGHPVVGPSGEVLEFIGTVVDVTERKAAEAVAARAARQAALRVEIGGALASGGSIRGMLQRCAEALVRQLECAFARIWTVPRGGSWLELQASAGLYTHLDGAHSRIRVGEQKIGRIAEARVPHLTNDVPGDPRIADKAWAAREGMVAFAGHPLIVEGRMIGVMAMFSRRALEPDTVEVLASVADSIAQGIERKRSEDELRRSEAYLAEGQRLSQTGSWAWKIPSGERFWSREVFRIYGFEPAESPPSLEDVRARLDPRDRNRVERTMERALRDAVEFELSTRLRLPEGRVRYILTVGHPVVDETGRLVELIGSVIDVTARRRAERRVRRAIRARYEAVLAERTRLAREMHDGLLQDVTGIALQLRAALPHVSGAPDETAATLEQILALAEHTSHEARRAIVGMRSSAADDDEDVVRAIEAAARRAAARATFALAVEVNGASRALRREIRHGLAGIVREAVTNVVKHANAREVRITLEFGDRALRLSITDDGSGFRTDSAFHVAPGHFGFVGMRERAATLGASLDVHSDPGCGTVVGLEVPYAG